MKNLLFCFTFLLSAFVSYTQPPCSSNPPAGNTCATATPICDLNGYCGSTASTYTDDSWSECGVFDPFCTANGLDEAFCGSIENNSFLSFTASSTSISFDVWVTSSTLGYGIQIFIFSLDNSCGNGDVTQYGPCYNPGVVEAGPVNITASGLTVGDTYYIMIDGNSGDVCDYVIGANSGISTPVSVSPSSQTICEGESIDLTASGGDGNYTWDSSPDLSSTTGSTVTATPPSTPGVYDYIVNSSSGTSLCPSSSSATATITVESCSSCSVTASNDGPFCSDDDNILTNLSATSISGATYSWTGPSGFSSSDQNPLNVSIPSTPGSYTFTVEVDDNGNICTSSTTVEINETPNANAGQDAEITCTTSEVVLNGSSTSSSVSYSWSGSGIVSGGNTLSPTVNQSGEYILTVEDQTTGCSIKDTVEVTENTTLPDLSSPSSAEIPCNSSTVDITISSSTVGVQYDWTGNDIVSGSNSSTVTVDNEGQYTITLTDPSNGCTVSDVVNVTYMDSISDVTIDISPSLCSSNNGSIDINNVNGGTSPYEFSLNQGPFGAQQSFNNLSPGTYTIDIVDDNGCAYQYSPIDVIGFPGIDSLAYTSYPTECGEGIGEIVIDQIYGGTGPYEIDHNSISMPDSVLVNLEEGVYTITVTDSNNCSYSTDIVVGLSVPLNGITPPNVFTPNNDNINDEWFVEANCIESFNCIILNRWGNVVFESSDIGVKWDGRSPGGREVSSGTYFYKIKVVRVDGSENELNGFLHLNR